MTCIIDGSHMRSTDLQYLIIREAINRAGLKLDTDDFAVYERAARDFPNNVSELADTDVEALGWIEDYALDALNDWGGTWWIDESCLWFDKYTDEEAGERQALYDDTWS